MVPEDTPANGPSDRVLAFSYSIILFFLTLSGFAQMPIFKRYYIADIPGLGWLAKFYVTHYIHYGGAVLLLAFLGYRIIQYVLADRSRIKITGSGYLRAAILGGILASGGGLVFRNLDDTWLSPGFIIFLDLAHLGLVGMFLATALYWVTFRKRWIQLPSEIRKE